MGAFAPDTFNGQVFGLLADGAPAFQGTAFDGGAFHILGDSEPVAHHAAAVRPLPVVPDEGEELFALI